MAGQDSHPGRAVKQGNEQFGAMADVEKKAGAGYIQMVNEYEKEYCHIVISSQSPPSTHRTELTIPEWIHIKRSPTLRGKIENNLEGVHINFDSPKDICVYYVGYERQKLVDKITDVLTSIRRTLEIQVYRIPTEHLSAALKQLQESDAYKTGKGTFWKSHDEALVFVVNKETRDGFDVFVSIICSLQSEDKRENRQPDDHHLQREVREMGEEASKVFHHISDKLTPSEMKALALEDKRIRNFVIKKIEEKGPSCSFDFKSGTVEFVSEENVTLQTKIYFHSLFNEVSKSIKGSSVLKGYSLEEICDNIYTSLGSASELVVIVPERDHQITIFGVAECVRRAEEALKYYMREFHNADVFSFQVPVETVSDALWQEITHIAENLPEGKIKVLTPDYDSQSLCAFGRNECITEFQSRVMTLCSFGKKEYPIMEPHLSLLKAKGDVVSYLTEEAKQKNIELEVELEKKRYSVAFRWYQQTEVEAFLRDWCKVYELKDVQGTEKTKEKIESDLKTYESEIYNRVLLKVDGSAIHLITTADDFDRVTAILKKFDEEKRTSEREIPISRQPSQTSRSSAESSHPGTDSSAAAAASSSAAATSASTNGDDGDYDEQITQSADGSTKFSCKLGYTLAEYCSKTSAFRQLVVEEFKTHGFEIQIDRDCKKAVTALSNEKDKAKVKHILNSFGARQFNLSGSNCCLPARELRDRLFKDKPSVRDKTIRIYVPADQNVLMVFGLKWQLDVLCPLLMDMIDDFEVQTFSISLASDLKENVVKSKLEREAGKMQPWKMVFENKVLKVEIAKSNLEEFRTVVYDLLEDMNAMKGEMLQTSFSVSQQMLDFLQRKQIGKELIDQFNNKNLVFSCEKCIKFGALSYRFLKQADALFKSCVSVTRYDLRSKPIGVMLQGDELTNIFEQREELVVFVDDAHVLNVICLSHVLQQFEKELDAKSDEYNEDTVRVSIEDLEMKMDSERLTSELFEQDRTLMSQAKVFVDGESVRIVARRNLLPHAERKIRQILLRIETEKEINCHNPHRVVKLDRLQVQLMEKPGIQENINRKMEEQHFQVLYNFKEGQVTIYGLTEKFVQNGKFLFESFFKKIELTISEDSVLKDHDFGALEEMVNDQFDSRMDTVVVETDPKKRTLIMVCISDDYAFVQEIIEEMKFVDAQVVHCREETVVYIERFLAEKLHEICGKDIFIKNKLNGVNSEFKIAGRKQQMLKAKAEIEKLCTRVVVQESPVDENVLALDKAQKNSSLSEIEAQFQCVIGIDEQGPTGQTNEQPATSANEWLKVEEADLSKLKTDAIALMFAERKLPNLIESSLIQAGVYDQFSKMTKTSKIMPSGAESVVFGEKKMLKCDHIAFCKMPHWESQGQSKQKEVVRTTTQCLLQDCMRRKVSEVSIVIAVENVSLFRRIAKQVIYEVMNTLKENHGTFSLRVQLITWNQSSTSRLRDILREACKDNDQVKSKWLKSKIKETLKGSQTRGAPRRYPTPEILLDMRELETKKIDVIVNSVNCSLDLKRGGVAKILNEKTGDKLENECKKKHPKGIKYGKVFETESCGLPCKKVLHGALDKFQADKEDQTDKTWKWKMMRTVISKCLKMASNDESIAFPALGTGNLGYPLQEAAATMFDEVQNFFNKNPSSKLKTVEFVLHPNDKNVVQAFTEELMSHYQKITGFQQSVIRSDGFAIQVLRGNGPCISSGSKQILCFWDSETMKDFTKHSVLGSAEELKENWKEIGAHLKKKKVQTGLFPSIFRKKNVLSLLHDDSPLGDSLSTALILSTNNDSTVLHVPLTGERDKRFVDLLKVHLLKTLKDLHQGCLQVIRIVTSDTMFEELSSHLQQEAFSNADNTGAYANSSGGELTRGKTTIVIAAKSDDVCKRALERVAQVFETSKFPLMDDTYFAEEEDAMGYTHISTVSDFQGSQMPLLNCNASLNPACQKIHDWKSVENKLKETYKMTILEKNGSYQVQCTSVTDFIAACNDLCKMWASKSSDKSSLVGRKRTGTSTTVSESMLRAVQHLIGDQQFDACCEVEDVSGSRKIFYLDNKDASSVEQRIQGMIQEEEPARDAAKDRAKKVAEQAMRDLMDVYIEYQPEKHVMLLFAEDWTVMDKAKKKVVSLFGQAKVSSRGARRFKQTDSSPVKPEEMSYDNDSGCAKGTNIHVKVYQADILNLKVDVIVNAANGQLTHGGGVARIIASAAGNQMTRESHQYYHQFGEIKVSEVGVTNAGKLPYKMVFHAVGPYWPDYKNKQECLEDLCRTILRCLCEADQRGIITIALPSISAAIFKVPKEKCAAMYVRALKSFDKYIKKTCLKEVHFVDITEEMVVRIREELKAKWHVPSDSSELAKDSAFIQQCLSSKPAHSVGVEPIVKSASKSLQLDEEPYTGAQAQSGPGETHKTKYEFNEHVSITVIKDDIFKMEANALVSWEEYGSMTLRPFQKQLVSEGGKRYEDVRKTKLTQAKKGDIVPTSSGNLIQSQVIHAYVGMETHLKDFVTLLTTLFQKCLNWNYTSVVLPVFQKFSSTVKGKKPVHMFTETVVDALRKLSEDKTKPDLRVIIVDEQEETVQDLSSALSQCLISLGLTPNSDMNNQGEKECPICYEKMPDLELLACGHGFCKGCLKKSFDIKKACPVCGSLYGPIFGTMPQGNMRDRTEWTSLPGFPGCNTIVITYSIPGGIQTEEHPNPGKPFIGASWTAYLPDSYEGRKVLALLKVAWERRLTFTVGRSVTRGGDEDRVTWNEIHHKTKKSGGTSQFGYPDDTYLERVQEELKQKGITDKDLDTPIH